MKQSWKGNCCVGKRTFQRHVRRGPGLKARIKLLARSVQAEPRNTRLQASPRDEHEARVSVCLFFLHVRLCASTMHYLYET